MPEATINENYFLAARENQIRTARQIPPMKSEPISQSVGSPTHDYLRFGVLRADSAHQSGARGAGR